MFAKSPSSPHFSVRLLTKDDAAAYQKIRLHSLQRSPKVFFASHESERSLPLHLFAEHLQQAFHPPYLGYFGIFDKEKLIGYVQISKNQNEKQQHIAFLNNLYLDETYRGSGAAAQLAEAALANLKEGAGVERVFLQCTASNAAAQQFYKKIGFTLYGTQLKALKHNEIYDDIIEMVKVL